jgi:hypothetical protein
MPGDRRYGGWLQAWASWVPGHISFDGGDGFLSHWR